MVVSKQNGKLCRQPPHAFRLQGQCLVMAEGTVRLTFQKEKKSSQTKTKPSAPIRGEGFVQLKAVTL